MADFKEKLLNTDDKECRKKGGERSALVDELIRNSKLSHQTCLLCNRSYPVKKSLYRHYRQPTSCIKKTTDVSLVKNSSKKRRTEAENSSKKTRTEAEKDSFRGKFKSGELFILIKVLK